jgi:hypothetical protein
MATTMHPALVPPVNQRRGPETLLRAVRLLADKWTAALALTPQDRANAYVARMPIAVLGYRRHMSAPAAASTRVLR